MMRLAHFDPLHKNEPSSLQSTLFDKKEYLHTRDKIRKSSAAAVAATLSSLTTPLPKAVTPATHYERIQNTHTGENSPLSAELDDVPESCVPLYCNDEQRELFKSLCQYAEQPNMTVKDILVPLSHPLLMEQKHKRSDLTVEHLFHSTKMKFLARFLTKIAKNSRKTYEVNILCNDYSMEYFLHEFVRLLHFDCKRFRDFYKGSENVYGVVVFSKGLTKPDSRLDVSLLLVYDSAVPPDLRTEDIFQHPSSALFTMYLTLVNTPEIRLFNYINFHPDEDITWTTPIHELSPSAKQCLLADFDYVETESDREWNDYMATKAYKWSLIDNKTLFRETRTRPHSFISSDQYQVRLKKRHLKRGCSDDTAAPEIADILSQVLYSSYGNRGNDHNNYSSNHSSSNISISGSSDGGSGGGGDGSIGSSGSRRAPRSVSPIPKAPRSMTYNDGPLDRATTYSKQFNDYNNNNGGSGSSNNNRHYRMSSTDMDEDSHINKSYYSNNRGPRASASPSPSISSTTLSYDESYHVENNLNRRDHHSNNNTNKRAISSEMGESAKRIRHSTREGSKLVSSLPSSLIAELSDDKPFFSTSPLKHKRPITLSFSKKDNNNNGGNMNANNRLKSPDIEQTRQRTPSSSPFAKHQRLLSPSRTKEEQSGRRSSPTINRVPGPSTSTNRDPRLSVSPVRELERPLISSSTTTATVTSSLLSPTVNKQLPIPTSPPSSLPIPSSTSSRHPTMFNGTKTINTTTSSPPPLPNANITPQKEPIVEKNPQLNNTILEKATLVQDVISEPGKTLSQEEPSLTSHNNITTDQQQQVKNVEEEKKEEKDDFMSTDNAMSEFEKALEKIHMQFQAALQE